MFHLTLFDTALSRDVLARVGAIMARTKDKQETFLIWSCYIQVTFKIHSSYIKKEAKPEFIWHSKRESVPSKN